MTLEFDRVRLCTSVVSAAGIRVFSLIIVLVPGFLGAFAADAEIKQRQDAVARLGEEINQRVGIPSLLSIVEKYDLTWRSRLARNTTLREEAFKNFVAEKRLNPAALSEASLDQLVLDYWQTTGRVSPEMAAWRALDINKPAWDAAMPHFRTIVQARPKDVPPRIVMLAIPPENDKQMAQWFDLVKEAYAVSANDNERLLSVMVPSLIAMSFGSNTFAAATFKEFGSWLEKIDLTDKEPVFKERIRIAQAMVAIGSGDIDGALSNAKDTPLFVLMPLWLMSKGEWARALETTWDVKKTSGLSRADKTMLNTFENILEEMVRGPEQKISK